VAQVDFSIDPILTDRDPPGKFIAGQPNALLDTLLVSD